jgi:hypothetical protein
MIGKKAGKGGTSWPNTKLLSKLVRHKGGPVSGGPPSNSLKANVLCALRLLLVLTLGELLDDLGAERLQVIGIAARDEPLVGHNLLV